MRDIGRQGDINAESEAFLLQIGIDYSAFTPEVIADLPQLPDSGWQIPPEVGVLAVIMIVVLRLDDCL